MSRWRWEIEVDGPREFFGIDDWDHLVMIGRAISELKKFAGEGAVSISFNLVRVDASK